MVQPDAFLEKVVNIVLTPLAKSVPVPLGLAAVVSVINSY